VADLILRHRCMCVGLNLGAGWRLLESVYLACPSDHRSLRRLWPIKCGFCRASRGLTGQRDRLDGKYH